MLEHQLSRAMPWLVAIFLISSSLQGCFENPYDDKEERPDDEIHRLLESRDPGFPPSAVIGQAPAQIQVLKQKEPTQDSGYEPVSGIKVEFYWVDLKQSDQHANKPATVKRYKTNSNKLGLAVIDAVDVPRDQSRYQLRATAFYGGMEHSFNNLRANAEGRYIGEIRMMQISGDVRIVTGGNLITTMRIPQGINQHPNLYANIQVDQIIDLHTTEWKTYSTGAAVRQEDLLGIPIELPLKAINPQGVVTIPGEQGDGSRLGQIKVKDSIAYYRGILYPPDDSKPSIRIMLRYYLKAEGSELDFELPLSIDWDDVSLTFIETTDLPDHPELDITIDAPVFSDQSNKAKGGALSGTKVEVVRTPLFDDVNGKRGPRAGDVIHARIKGLPYPDRTMQWYVFAIGGVIFIVGAFLGVKEVRRARQRQENLSSRAPEALAELDAQIEALYRGMEALEADFREGDVTEKSRDQEHERLKARLVLLMQLRGERSTPEQPAA